GALPRAAGWVIVHDGVRPFATAALFERCLEAARRTGASLAAVPVSDTLKKEAKEGERGRKRETSPPKWSQRGAGFETPPEAPGGRRVGRTLSREGLWRAQTPQAFRRELLEGALKRAQEEGFVGTDEASLVERLGEPVELVEGEAWNLKVTTADDLAMAEAFSKRGSGARVGVGVDFHRLVAGRKLVLGGVEIPYHLGLLGHSDGDVLTHAICDALLGAGALGDIGLHFPDTDPTYRGISSLRLLEMVGDLLKEKGFVLGNVDATLIAEAPRIAPHCVSMRRALAAALGVEEARVSIKATTAEGLGALGRGEGMAAHATCTLRERGAPGQGGP
ncbi:MAG: 2-C-methyl-D-erythritol 2,4-cyclodiphosphate synthase, partial [Nitrospinota bacterium]